MPHIAVVEETDKVFDLVLEAARAIEPAVAVVNVSFEEAGSVADLVLLDAPARGEAGLDEIALHARRSRTPIAVFTATPTVDTAIAYVRAGARGYLAKDAACAHLAASLEQLLGGRCVIDPALGGELLHAVGHNPMLSWSGMTAGLTRREGEVLDLLRRGLTNREISERLVVGSQTVKSHVHRIYRKLGVTGRVDLI